MTKNDLNQGTEKLENGEKEAKHQRVTRKDVAREAGVTETIVSYVLNNNRYVNQEKKQRVLAAVKKLGYRPNNAARALKGKSLNHIVFIADQIVTEHFSLLLSEMDKKAYDLGYIVALCQNRNTDEFVNSIISRQFDGVIISSISFPKDYIREIIRAGIPVVLLENRDYSDIDGAGKIDNGLYGGARDVVRYLDSLNRKNIIYIDRFSQHDHYSDMSDMRYRGFVNEMRERNLSAHPENQVITGCKSPEEIGEKVKRYLEMHPEVNAVFGRNDRVACVAMHAAQEIGKKIPEDIAVVGFDNSILGQYTTPSLTSVEIPRDLIAGTAIEMLQQMIVRHEMPEKVVYHTSLIKRNSTEIRTT